jgi:branched-chain amino acid transport system permease protein
VTGATPTAARSAIAPRTIIAAMFFGTMGLLPIAVTALGDPFLVVVLTRMIILALAALSLDLILGHGALVSFGHAAFVGIGAYAVVILAQAGITDIAVQVLAAIVVAAVFGLITGLIVLRTRGVYFIMITLAFGQMAYFFFVSLSAYGGDDGISMRGRSTLFGRDWLENDMALFYLALAVLLGGYVLAAALVGSRFGRVISGTRENPVRMQAMGFRPFGYQLLAYVIAGCMAAVAGVLLANQTEFVSPAFMSWQRSGELIVMVVLGGLGTLIGPIFGAVAVLLLEEVLSPFSSHWRIGLGVVLILVVFASPGGLAGMLRRLTGRGA